MWYYRICKRHRMVLGTKQFYYCIVEYYPKVERKDGRMASLWSDEPEWPVGDTKEELIECLKMMLKDAQRYPVLVQKNATEDKNEYPKS